ncbi:MAG: Dot/Icm secretion system protein IcmQ, partial [Pseudomonadota bacterium]
RDEQIQHIKVVVESLNEAIAKIPVDKGTFYKAIADRLIKIRSQYLKDLGLDVEAERTKETAVVKADESALVEVYISIYSAEGMHIEKWAKLLDTMLDRIITRPIYENEQHAITALRNAVDKQKEAYIAISIPKTSIMQLTEENRPKDRYGNFLLVIDDKGLDKTKISKFVHKSGLYRFVEHKLVLEKPIHFL